MVCFSCISVLLAAGWFAVHGPYMTFQVIAVFLCSPVPQKWADLGLNHQRSCLSSLQNDPRRSCTAPKASGSCMPIGGNGSAQHSIYGMS